MVVREKTRFLRIIDPEPVWELITATANEDHGRIRVCGKQLRLMEAWRGAGNKASDRENWMKRDYAKLCGIR